MGFDEQKANTEGERVADGVEGAQAAGSGKNGVESGSLTAEDRIKKLEDEAQKFKNEYLYLRAEFDNYKKNAIKERSELIKYGSERLLIDLLAVHDIFKTALDTKPTEASIESYVKGIEMTAAEFKSVLTRFGVQLVETFNKPFDPMFMEALGSEVVQGIEPGFVSKVFKDAYKLHDKIIRPAQVVVAKAE